MKKSLQEFTENIIKHTLLSEAKVAPKNVERAVELFVSLFERKMKTKLYRYGGPKGYSQIRGGVGVLFFYNQNKAIRFNYDGKEITSITLWDAYKLGKVGDRTIDLAGIGLTKAAHEILKIIAGCVKAGKIEFCC
jgi:hypothetical protein